MFRVALATLLFVFAHVASAEQISIVGSTSVSRVMDILAEDYNKTSPENPVAVQGIGSSAGVTLVNKKVSELGMSSRYLTEAEAHDSLKIITIAYDGLALVVNHTNPITNLTREQLSDIYHGNITNWKEVGGDNKKIAVVTRETASGTRYSFESLLGLTQIINQKLVSDISHENLVVNSNSMVKTIVSNNPHAIGYISIGSVDASVKPVQFEGIAPTAKSILEKKYELRRPFLVFYDTENVSKESLGFVDYLTKPHAQDIIERSGYIKFH
ncbi:phosphate ABC transporter substrate-binding protein [Vibrio ulleungensis]|uniref:Phosphate-binding protein n=1 Tax=Vibrio ulleungensis TaxID=2807619 RepID=A0ABS2HDG8_9VIBR|nr:phosphate ABC transporter substrate-binding protein [Vibrio ulleungensis]MBM7035630.1 phosphate ABC transporter substrate-binding protein [Vibrio ulleungensis]